MKKEQWQEGLERRKFKREHLLTVDIMRENKGQLKFCKSWKN